MHNYIPKSHYTKIDNRDMVAMNKLSPNASKLLMYYLQKTDGWVFDNEQTIRAIDISLRTFKKVKNELIDAELLWIEHNSREDDYYLGIEAVRRYKLKHKIEEEEG